MADPAAYPVGTIAKLFDLTDRRVQQLAAEGVIPRPEGGRYELVGCVRGYVKYLRDRQVNADAKAGGADVGKSRSDILKAKARLVTLEAEKMEGSLLRRLDVDRAWQSIITTVRARLLAVPSKASQAIIYLDSPVAIASFLTAALTEALDDLASHPVYVEADRHPQPGGGEGGPDGVEVIPAAAEADRVAMGG